MSSFGIYLAGPFFTDDQIKVIEMLEEKISSFGCFELISPRKSQASVELGEMLQHKEDYTQEDMDKKCLEVFKVNCVDIERSSAVIAFIDGFDSGTMYEIGYAFKARPWSKHLRWIISFSNAGEGVGNLMIGCSVDCHCRSIDTLERALYLLNLQNNMKIVTKGQFKSLSDSLGFMV